MPGAAAIFDVLAEIIPPRQTTTMVSDVQEELIQLTGTGR